MYKIKNKNNQISVMCNIIYVSLSNNDEMYIYYIVILFTFVWKSLLVNYNVTWIIMVYTTLVG